MGRGASSAGAEQMQRRQLLQAHEAVALAAEVRLGVELLPGRAVGEQLLVALARREGWRVELADLGRAIASCTSGSARNAAARSFSSR